MTKIWLAVAAGLVITGTAFFFISNNLKGYEALDSDKAIVEIGGKKFEVELAETVEKQSKGLSGRESLARNEGMLFIFQKPAFQSIWMRGMKFPIDIIWINGDQVVGVTKNVLLPNNINSADLPVYRSPEPVDLILEIMSGQSDQINIGDKVKIRK